jgi:hypothetical protein
MHPHESLPRARKDDLLEETVGEELLLYDQDNHTAHCLSPIAAGVWRHCDGERDVTKLAERTGASESLVAEALNELREKDLLDPEPTLQSTVPGISRREAIVRVARVGAAAAAAPLIVSATAATPAMASSGETLMCCQCYKNQNPNEPCACRNGFPTNTACNIFCLKEPSGCSNGVLIGNGTTCGMLNRCM